MMAMRQTMLGSVATPVPTYTVTFSDGDNLRDSGYWTITLTKGDNTRITPTLPGTYSDIKSISVEGKAYRDLSEGSAAWYDIWGTSSYSIFFSGNGQRDTTSYSLSLTANITIQYTLYVNESGCFSEHMKVKMANGTDKFIGEVVCGNLIKAWNCIADSDREELIDAAVEFSSAGLIRTAPRYERYVFEDGTEVEIINADRLYNVEDNKMKWMDQWEIGEHGLTYDGREVALVSHETVEEPIVFHDITCAYYNYYINGMLAGQKRARWPFFPSRGHHGGDL